MKRRVIMKTRKRILSFVLAVLLTLSCLVSAPLEPKAAGNVSVSYRTHVQNIGWQDFRADGVMAGTDHRSLRLEGIEIKLNQPTSELGITYTTHCQDYGWLPWSANGEMNGTEGESKRLEAIKIKLTGTNAANYSVWYRVHAQNLGWLSWTRDGAPSGTAGMAYRLEGIQIVVLPKNQTPTASFKNVKPDKNVPYAAKNGSTTADVPGEGTTNIAYRTHVQNVGWQGWKYNGTMSGTSGRSLRLEGIYIKLTNQQYQGSIKYRTHVQNIGWQNWMGANEMSGTSGRSLRLEGVQIYLTGEMARHYDIWYRVHAQNLGWLSWAKNGEPAGSAGYAYRLEGIQIVLKAKNSGNPGAVSGIPSANAQAFVRTPNSEVPYNPVTGSGGNPSGGTDPYDDTIRCSYKTIANYDGISFIQSKSVQFGTESTDYWETQNTAESGEIIEKELTQCFYVNKAVDARYFYIKYNGDDGFRDLGDRYKQYFPDMKNPTAYASISYCEDAGSEVMFGAYMARNCGDPYAYDTAWERVNYMEAQGYTKCICVGISYTKPGSQSFDLYYKNKKIATIKNSKTAGAGTGAKWIKSTRDMYNEVSAYKSNMTTPELIDAGMYWIAKHTYEEYTCNDGCVKVEDMMKMHGCPGITIWTNSNAHYPGYVSDSPKVDRGGMFHSASIVFIDSTHYTIVEVQGRYGSGCPETWTQICQPHKLSLHDSWYGPTNNISVYEEVEFLKGYKTVYDMMKGDYGVDITKFDPYNCATWF